MSDQIDKPRKTSAINWNYVITLIAIVVIIGLLFVFRPWEKGGEFLESEKASTTLPLTTQKPSCPSDCCIDGTYQIKQCQPDYECINNQCVAKDSDKDGLTDVQEKEFGSNAFVYDTDSDGLNDYQEKQKGTDPNNPNTDGDRYDDKTDSNPTLKNTAIINIETVKKEWGWEWLGILDLLENLKNLNPDFTIATVKVDIRVNNDGSDYTSYVKFDNVFKIQGIEVMRISERIDRINENDFVTKHYEYKFTAKEVPETVWEWIKTKTTNWSYEIQNLVYEKF